MPIARGRVLPDMFDPRARVGHQRRHTQAARPVHFRATLNAGSEGPRMIFHYRLRHGLATTTNALELLRQVGLDLPED
jgi:hypothetical protein